MANGFTNFMNGLSNEAQRRLSDPLVDLWALAAKWVNKWLDWITWDDLSKTTNAKIDKAAQEIKAQMKEEVDPTSTAWAVWEWLIAWLDNANIVLWLAQLAKQIWRKWLKELPKLLKKYENAKADAKNKQKQLDAVKEIKEYIQRQSKDIKPVEVSEAPAYQQKARAKAYNDWQWEEAMEKFANLPSNEMKTYDNLTDSFRTADAWDSAAKESGMRVTWEWSKGLKEMAVNKAINPRQSVVRDLVENDVMSPLSAEEARKLWVPYKDWNKLKAWAEFKKQTDAVARRSTGWGLSYTEMRDMERYYKDLEKYANEIWYPWWAEQALKDYDAVVGYGVWQNPNLVWMSEKDFMRLASLWEDASLDDLVRAWIDMPNYRPLNEYKRSLVWAQFNQERAALQNELKKAWLNDYQTAKRLAEFENITSPTNKNITPKQIIKREQQAQKEWAALEKKYEKLAKKSWYKNLQEAEQNFEYDTTYWFFDWTFEDWLKANKKGSDTSIWF